MFKLKYAFPKMEYSLNRESNTHFQSVLTVKMAGYMLKTLRKLFLKSNNPDQIINFLV